MADHQGNILIADDGRAVRTVLSRKLTLEGYVVTESSGGIEALEKIVTTDFDLIILDNFMPDLSGLEVLQKVRETRSATELPIIMATANEDNDDMVRAFEFGANDYVTKPINFPVLLARIDTHLRLKRTTEELRRELDSKNGSE